VSLDFSLYAVRRTEVFDTNITHNLGAMASEAGIYDCLWRAPENGFVKADQMIPLLTRAVEEMKADPERFKKFDSPNGWGLYKHFLPWVEKILAACIENPDAEIHTSR
jgi:hypothetical protein